METRDLLSDVSLQWFSEPAHKVCPPDYTPKECARCRSDDPRCYDHDHPKVPEPDVAVLLFAGLVAAVVVRRFRRK